LTPTLHPLKSKKKFLASVKIVRAVGSGSSSVAEILAVQLSLLSPAVDVERIWTIDVREYGSED
jgi:hypothetical protein